jgi:uncharacterized protein YyaL (SSP411 family)
MTDADATKVEWYDWGAEPFEVAERTGRPILLALVTSWAEECTEMDTTTYAEPAIAANINDSFVPIRVDADKHPRVREWYNMGGFPSTVFLTPEGEILTGATLLKINGFRGILDKVRMTWDSKGVKAGSLPRALRETDHPAGTVDHRVEEKMVEQLLAAYDGEFGGWGTDSKFPMPRTVEFALVRARDQATRTLEAVHTHLNDTYDGGFYRVARNRNWGAVRREKLLDENAAIVRAFSHAYRYTGEETYREAAESGVEYLTSTLWTGDGFAASQGGNEEYFTLGAADREEADRPVVDETVLADRNGLAIDSLLWYVAYTDDERARRRATQARDHVCETLVDDDGRVSHYNGEDAESGLLLDQARLLTGLTTSWQVAGEPGPAAGVAEWTIETLRADDGAFRDGPAEGAGLLDMPLYPLDTTTEFADALLDLSLLTGEERYETVAREALAAYAGATDRMGVEVAHYATVAARLQQPTVVTVGTEDGTDLHRAALRLADHETVVAVRSDGATSVADDVPDREAQLRVDGSVEGTADSPAALESLLTD